MLNKKALLRVLCSSLLLTISPLLYGQATGSFSGTVSDKTGSVISGATVRVTSQGTGAVREAKTDDTGHYLIPLVPIGTYTVRVESQGFQPNEQRDVRLQVDEHHDADFTMSPASVSSTVEVSATEVAVETSNPTLGQVITSEQVANLPLNGRDFVQLATLTPGTTQETNPNSFANGGPSSEVATRGTFSLSVGGSRANSTDWLLDGVDNNELTSGGIGILPSIDALQEFKVLSYVFSAEYGTRAGPAVLLTTKSGTNQLHGSVFEFFRNTSLDARSYFAASREKFNLNQFGAAVGGPLDKDKTFFFVDYEATRRRLGIPFIGLIPTQAMVNGDFSNDPLGTSRPGKFDYVNNPVNANQFPDIVNPYTFTAFQCDPSGNPIAPNSNGSQNAGTNCNKIPTGMFDLAGGAMMQLYPQSTTPNLSSLSNFAAVPVRTLNEGKFDLRLDHTFSAKDTLFARFSYDQAVTFIPGGSPGYAAPSPFASSQNITNHGRNAAVSETHIFSPNNINQLTFGFNRIFNHIKSFGDGTCEAANLGILGADLNTKCVNGIPGFSQSSSDCMSCSMTATLVGGYWGLGDRGFAPFQGGTNVFSVVDSFDMIRGHHNIRFGGSLRAMQMNVETNAFQDGFFINFSPAFSGDGAADLLLGQMVGTVHDQTFLGATTGRRWKLFRPYIQDDWRVTPSLTINIGVAWALTTPTVESGNRQANLDLASGKLLVAGNIPIAGCTFCVRSGPRVGLELDKTAFEPRIGFAWKPFGSQNTAVRAGYAIFHDSSWNQGAQGLFENPPYFAESDNFNGPFPCPFNNTALPIPNDCGLQRGFLPLITSPPNPSQFPGAFQTQNLNFKQGRVQQLTLNIEHQLPGNVVLTAGYAGSRSSHILVSGLNINLHDPNACPDGATPVAGYTFGCGYKPPFSTLGNVIQSNDVGRARYDSLQVKAETKSARHGVYALFGYTWSRTFDSGLTDGLGSFPGAMYWPLPGMQKADWGLSAINANNQFTASVIYDLPFGKGKKFGGGWKGATNSIFGSWSVNVIERALSGFPLFVIDSSRPSGVNFVWNSGTSFDRPDEVGDPNKAGPVAANPGCTAPSKVHTLQNWFNPCAFKSEKVVDPITGKLTPTGKLGTAPRAPVYGPRFVNTDLSLVKNFLMPWREGLGLQFRAEFFNLFNHPNFYLGGDGGFGFQQNIASPTTFGLVNATVGTAQARVMQFALKLNF